MQPARLAFGVRASITMAAMIPSDSGMFAALSDFRRARQRAALQQVLARLTGRSMDLLSYDEVARQIKPVGRAERGLRDIPLDAITGSVGRPNDFTRDFLPRQDSDENRWARVRAAVTDPAATGLPPIEVYQIGDAYFVIDGHHRVSVARQLGATHIQAHVTELQTKVPLSPSVTPEELVLKSEYANFLDETQLDRTRPDADLSASLPGRVQHLLEEIRGHQQSLSRQRGQAVPLEEAAADWHDNVYLPAVYVIRENGMLRDFPGQTEADLYLLVMEHRAALERSLGWSIKLGVGASDLAAQQAAHRQGLVSRASQKLFRAVVPVELRGGPAVGQWRRERLTSRYADHLIADILVPVSGEPIGFQGLDQALDLARLEGAELHGLHVVSTEAQRESPETRAVREEFDRRCQDAAVPGNLAIEVGEVAATICELAALSDLVVLNLAYPPAPAPMARLGSGFRTIIHRCPRPVLAVPEYRIFPERPLLAYDGSPKAEEALFVATYLAEARKTPLAVVTVIQPGQATQAVVDHARDYLAMHEVEASFIVRESSDAAGVILAAVAEQGANLIVSGGYGAHPMVEVVLGSTIDRVLREARQPVLICR
jgi:nucleotide-binding universal stress UspA family protein